MKYFLLTNINMKVYLSGMRYNHDIEYIDDYNNDFDDNRDCYKLEHWIKFQEINREKFFEIEEYDLCKTDKDYQKLKEKSKWLKWKTKNELNKYYVLDEELIIIMTIEKMMRKITKGMHFTQCTTT